MTPPTKTPVTLVTGLDRGAAARLANALATPGTALVAHDLRALPLGYVVRQTRIVLDGDDRLAVEQIALDHGCATCTLQLDLLPQLRTLHRDPDVDRIVVVLDPVFEPEPVATEILGTIAASDEYGDAPAGDDVVVRATVTAIDEAHWLADATGDLTLCEAGLSSVEDERTLAQVAVAQARFADVLVIEGSGDRDDRDEAARLAAVLRRLNPAAIQTAVQPDRPLRPDQLLVSLAAIRPQSRRGRPTGVFDPLLDGCPPLDADCGVEVVTFEADRPFHPGRLYDALDVLLDGVVCARGRLWLTSSPDDVVWLESAGGGLGLSRSARWLAARNAADLADVSPEVRAMASLRWDVRHGDRHSSIVVLSVRADRREIDRALHGALVTDDELARGPGYLASLPTPFGDDGDARTPTDEKPAGEKTPAETNQENIR